MQNFDRRTRVRALSDCKLIYINKDELYRTFPQAQIKSLETMMRNLDLDYLVKKIENQYKSRKNINNAILDATGVNKHDFSGERSSFIGVLNQKAINKLQPWLEKARKKTTKNKHILHQLKKVKLLSNTEGKIGNIGVDMIESERNRGGYVARFFITEADRERIVNEAAHRKLKIDNHQKYEKSPEKSEKSPERRSEDKSKKTKKYVLGENKNSEILDLVMEIKRQ